MQCSKNLRRASKFPDQIVVMHDTDNTNTWGAFQFKAIDQFQYIKIQPKTV